MGFPPIPERAPKSAKTAFFFLRKKYAFFTQKVRFSALFGTKFLVLAETPLFVQINVFAVWALRLDRNCTRASNYRGAIFLHGGHAPKSGPRGRDPEGQKRHLESLRKRPPATEPFRALRSEVSKIG